MISEKEQRCILTTRGPVPLPQDLSNCLAFSHQYIQPEVSNNPSKPLTLQTLPFHLKNPITLENTSLTATLLQHQLLSVKAAQPNIPQSNYYLINASTSSKNKTPEPLAKYNIIKGYTYSLPQSLKNSLGQISKQVQAMTSPDHIMKQIEYQFALNTEQSGFIGEINLPEQIQLMKNDNYSKAFMTTYGKYQIYSEKNQCPIMVGLLGKDQQGFNYLDHSTAHQYLQAFQTNMELFMEKLATNNNAIPHTILVNPKFIIQQNFNLDNQQIPFNYSNISLSIIQKIYQQGFTVCFDLLRYSRDPNSLCWIASLLQKYPKNTILSCGIQFKTDLQQFGGEGLILSQTLPFLKRILGENALALINRAMTDNIMRKLCWYIKRIIVQEVKMWTCVKCSKQSPETEQAFRKFGKDFCSITCLKAFKF